MFPHQHVVATDVGLALGAVENQQLAVGIATQFFRCGKDRAAETDNPGVADGIDARRPLLRPFPGRRRFIFSVGFQMHAQR